MAEDKKVKVRAIELSNEGRGIRRIPTLDEDGDAGETVELAPGAKGVKVTVDEKLAKALEKASKAGDTLQVAGHAKADKVEGRASLEPKGQQPQGQQQRRG